VIEIRQNAKPCECLDLVEIAHKERIYPVMFCQMNIKGHLNKEKMKEAILKSTQYIPELLYSIDFHKCLFVDKQHTVEQVINNGDMKNWDLSIDPQIKISIISHFDHDQVIIGMSHILCDGNGFIQYLYLLSKLYNGKEKEKKHNVRNIKQALQKIPKIKSYKKEKIDFISLCHDYGGHHQYCLFKTVGKDEFTKIHLKAKALNVTLNDVFMSCYAKVVLNYLNISSINIPSPVNLRQYNKIETLTIGNMTGMCQAITFNNDPLDQMLLYTHQQMQKQKSDFLCFKGIKTLSSLNQKIPARLLVKIIQASFHLKPLSYSNMGRIDHNKLVFDDCTIESCFLTGTYRKSPDFQLNVSTFNDVCTFNCMLLGNEQRRKEGEYLLNKVVDELIWWGHSHY